MAHNYEHNPGTDDARPDRDDGTAVRPKKEGHNYPEVEEKNHYCVADGKYYCPCGHIKEIRKDVAELVRTVNQIVRLLRNWVNVSSPELMTENLREIPIDEPPS